MVNTTLREMVITYIGGELPTPQSIIEKMCKENFLMTAETLAGKTEEHYPNVFRTREEESEEGTAYFTPETMRKSAAIGQPLSHTEPDIFISRLYARAKADPSGFRPWIPQDQYKIRYDACVFRIWGESYHMNPQPRGMKLISEGDPVTQPSKFDACFQPPKSQ
ncbi:MAG: hypothetical protein Q7R96_04925 [Nanoarchaeota archaeon]|nr:hypothetical protein [Nanoarchaeota archaeon]